MPSFDPVPLVLTGEHVLLEPLAPEHVSDLFAAAAADREMWRYMPVGPFDDEDAMRAHVAAALAEADSGGSVPFATVLCSSGVAVGSTRYLDVQRAHRTLEIGFTWLGPEQRRTAVNTECKLLLLAHAFEELGALRVSFKTDLRNERSQRAIERVGGVREGVFRKHMTLPDGHVRDSVYYSIVDVEWPAARRRLEGMLAPH